MGMFLETLTKVMPEALAVKFGKLSIFTKIVVTYFIESSFLKLFSLGLDIVKNLLSGSPRVTEIATQLILEYEESCNTFSFDNQSETLHKSFLDILQETLCETLHKMKPVDLVKSSPARHL